MAQYSIYDIIALLVSIMLPPLGVVMKRGFESDFWINIILTLLGWLPGLFHAFYVIHKYRDESNSGEVHPFGGTRPETVKIHSTTPPPSKQPYQPHNQPYHQPQHQPQHQSQYKQQYQPQYQQHSYSTDKGSVVKDAQAEPSNEDVSQAYPPTYGNHGKDEKLEGQSNAYYTDYSNDKKRHK
ncbi:4498_t:CDS:2 [Funneliformis geosporum]|uniref:18827_t:CDS:1 n=1 Tax=Funneliformis geosporum TaxID=1117311 RepID=A0A9W4WP89_9GLOM|nr:4498_t:CDS:2 [Funneliformis geosporum]CAI2168696.1 18827_t:CDS:2 [Funneliformis geosporum]